MQYMGGKQRIAKQIASLLQPLLGSGYYVEPFVGGAAVAAQLNHPHRIAADLNESLITLWRALYAAPSDFTCVLEIPTSTSLRTKTGRDPRIKKLFSRNLLPATEDLP